jgi:arylsulfatase A-like enzyme
VIARFTQIVLVLAAVGALGFSERAAAKSSPPNVLMIVSDDQGYGDYGFMGHPHLRTPNIDRLANEGLTFRHGYVPSSVCRPSLVSILTGLYPHEHKITSNDPPPAPTKEARQALRERQIAYIDRVATLPRLLSPKGYVSLQTGKWWEGTYDRGGFTHGMTHGDPERQGRHGDEGLLIGRQGIAPIREFLDETAGKPFFIWYAPMMPHNPHNPPEKYRARYRGKAGFPEQVRYWAMCEWFDETCGEVLNELEQRGLSENTIVVYVTDNGWISQPGTHKQDPRSKMSPYDGGLRTPIILHWPGRVDHKFVDAPVSSIDLAPTLLKMLGVEPPPETTGVNLLDEPAVAARKTIFGETFAHEAVDVDRPETCLQYRWCVQWPWKLIVPNERVVAGSRTELFNLQNDPREEHDLAALQTEIVAELRSELDEWWAAN